MKNFVKWQGILHILYSAAMIIYAGIHTTFVSFWTLTGVLLLMISHLNGKSGTILRIMTAAGDVLLILQITKIFIFGRQKPEQGADYVIVLGAQVKGDRPSRALLRRIHAAAAYMRENPTCMAVACGGKGKGEWITESQCIRDTLIDIGIERERILCENRSVSTFQNLMFAKEIIGTDRSVVIVSNSFHLYRAIEIAKRVGFLQCKGIGTRPEPMLEMNYYVRECLSLWYNRLKLFHKLK